MVAYRDGEAAAFDLLVRRHRDRLHGFFLRMRFDRARAEELTADVFLKIHQAAPRYEPIARFTTWAWTVAYRAALNARDRARHQLDAPARDRVELQGARSQGADPERHAHDRAALAAVDREIAALPDEHRAAFLLYYGEGLDCADTAAALGITPAEAKGRLAYARKLLRQRLSGLLAERTEP